LGSGFFWVEKLQNKSCLSWSWALLYKWMGSNPTHLYFFCVTDVLLSIRFVCLIVRRSFISVNCTCHTWPSSQSFLLC
jgi:hypothetical protein